MDVSLKYVIRTTAAILIWNLSICSLALGEENTIHLSFNSRSFSEKIRQTPRKDIIKKINEKTGIWFKLLTKENGSGLDEKVSVQFKNISIEDGLDRIFGTVNHCLIFDQFDNVVGAYILGMPIKYRFRRTRRRFPRVRPRRR